MRELIVQLFGEYIIPTYDYSCTVSAPDPVTGVMIDTVTTYTGLVPGGLAGVDWTYIVGILFFAILLNGFMRCIASLISWKIH